MTHVSRSIEFSASASDVWAHIGGFQDLADWHPAVQGSAKEESGGVEHRRLDLGGGASIFEKWLGSDGTSYAYEILDPGPLPITSYRGTLSVAPSSKGSVVSWSATFEPAGAPEADAAGAVSGIYEAGFAALSEKFVG